MECHVDMSLSVHRSVWRQKYHIVDAYVTASGRRYRDTVICASFPWSTLDASILRSWDVPPVFPTVFLCGWTNKCFHLTAGPLGSQMNQEAPLETKSHLRKEQIPDILKKSKLWQTQDVLLQVIPRFLPTMPVAHYFYKQRSSMVFFLLLLQKYHIPVKIFHSKLQISISWWR